jgi:hypothetical protein
MLANFLADRNRMRALAALALLVFGVAGTASAGAADLRVGGGTHGYNEGAYFIEPERAGALIIYDFEPGVTIRAYWLPPWRNRHYFPFGAAKVRPVSSGGRPKPAESYFRYWSNSGAFLDDPPPAALRAFDAAPTRRRQQGSTLTKP